MQDLVLFYVPLAPVASLARYLISLAAWFKLSPVLESWVLRNLYGDGRSRLLVRCHLTRH
jgi:hypothetical protein